MQQIRIIQGTYGHRPDGTHRIRPVSAGGLVSVPDEEAERLMRLGVAEPVTLPSSGDCEDVATPQDGQTEGDAGIGMDVGILCAEDSVEGDTVHEFTPEELNVLTNAKLKGLAEDLGISTAKLKNKAELIDAILSAQVTPGPEGDDMENGEQLPELRAEAPVT